MKEKIKEIKSQETEVIVARDKAIEELKKAVEKFDEQCDANKQLKSQVSD